MLFPVYSTESHTVYRLLESKDLERIKGLRKPQQSFSVHQHQCMLGYAHDFLAKVH